MNLAVPPVDISLIFSWCNFLMTRSKPDLSETDISAVLIFISKTINLLI